MTRLFLRFYLGVILILVGAWMLQAYASHYLSPPENRRAFESFFSSGFRLARKMYVDAGETEASLVALEDQLGYPIEVVPLDSLPAEAQRELAGEKEFEGFEDEGFFTAAELPDGKRALRFGPMLTPRGPSESAMLGVLGVLLALVAAAIALLLRPVSRQLRMLESTATAIAAGDFSVRVDERRVTSARLLARAMNEMAQRTESLLRTQREMLQAVSHELRTPLSRMAFAIDLLRTEDGAQREARLNSLESAAQELDALVGELLHYVRWESGQPQVGEEEIELRPLVERVIEQHGALHPTKQFLLGKHLSREEICLRGDGRTLERAIGNVIANAARFATGRVQVECAASAERVQIDVDDDGPGVPVAERARIFDPFVRLDDSGRGTGLGLALVRRIVTHYGGTVEALNADGGGCRIRIVLPIPSNGGTAPA